MIKLPSLGFDDVHDNDGELELCNRLKAARAEGVDIPGRLAVAGFSDSPMCELVTPELTSVEQPAHRLGMVAARLLFDLIEDEQLADRVPQQVVLQPKLKIRRSCGNEKYIYELFE